MAEAFSPYVGAVGSSSNLIGLATEEDLALPVTAPAAPGIAYSPYVGAVTSQTAGLATEEDLALAVTPLGGVRAGTIGDAALYICGNDIVAAYTPGVSGGAVIQAVGLAIEEDIALPLERPVISTLPFPTVALEVAFQVDPGKYGFAYDTVARALVGLQYLRVQESSTALADRSRRGNNATGHGGLTYQQPSPISDPAAKSIILDGTSAYLSQNLAQITDSVAITVIAWVKQRVGGRQTLLGWPDCSIGWDASGAYFGLTTDPVGGVDWFAMPDPGPGSWHLYTFTLYPENTLDGYATLDGVFVDDLQQRFGSPDPPPPTFANIDFSSGNCTWGRDYSSAAHYFDGSLGELLIVPYAVPIDTLATLYAAKTSPAAPPTDPSTFVWTPLTSRLTEASMQMGRNSELDRIETAQASFTLDNNDRALEPEFTGSPYSPNVVPMRPIRCRATVLSTGYQPMYYGYVSDWGVRRPSYIRGAVDVTAVDAGEALMQDAVNLWLPQQMPGARVHDLLDAAGWPTDQRSIATGTLLLAETDYSDSPITPIDALNACAESEGGYFFFDRNGIATFHDQDTRSGAPYNSPSATFGDGAGEMPYLSPTPDYGVHQIKNVVTVNRPGTDNTGDTNALIVDIRDASSFADLQTALPTRPGGFGTIPPAIAIDTASIQKYRRRELTLDTQLASGEDAGGRAQAALLRYKNPTLRFVALQVEPKREPTTMFPAVLTLGLAYMIVIVARPNGGGAPLIKASYIEAIQHQFAVGQERTWQTSFALSPVLNDPGSGISYWVLGSSVLGYDTRLGL